MKRKTHLALYADMAELADALDLGSSLFWCEFEAHYLHHENRFVTLIAEGVG